MLSNSALMATPRRRLLLLFILLAAATVAVLAFGGRVVAVGPTTLLGEPSTERVSLASDGSQADNNSYDASISADGRYVAFRSYASNLVPSDTNGYTDVFVRDRTAGATERVSIAWDGSQAITDCGGPRISADGRDVAFDSRASNLVPSDTNGNTDIFVRDRVAGTTDRVSLAFDGSQASGDSQNPSISADGRHVAFYSYATNLVPTNTNSFSDIFVRDQVAGTTERVSVSSSGAEADSDCRWPSISSDGRYVAFYSLASNLVPSDTNNKLDIFVRDRVAGATERVSLSASSEQASGDSQNPNISADGRYVAFWSHATNLVPSDTNGTDDIFIRDRVAGATERVSVSSSGAQAGSNSYNPTISADGRYVAFYSLATTLVPSDTNSCWDVFVRDRVAAATERVSVSSDGDEADGCSYNPSISADGRYVAFDSNANNLVLSDTNGYYYDVFVRDRGAAAVGAVGGSVNLQGRANDGGAVITVGAYTATTASSGAFTLSNVAVGTYTATASASGYLFAQRGSVVVAASETTTLLTVTLLGGDVAGNNTIDIYDLTAIGASFGTAGGNADINGDGAVNIFDLVMVGANFGRSAPLPWP